MYSDPIDTRAEVARYYDANQSFPADFEFYRSHIQALDLSTRIGMRNRANSGAARGVMSLDHRPRQFLRNAGGM